MSSSNPRRIGVAFEVEEREVEGHEVEEREGIGTPGGATAATQGGFGGDGTTA